MGFDVGANVETDSPECIGLSPGPEAEKQELERGIEVAARNIEKNLALIAELNQRYQTFLELIGRIDFEMLEEQGKISLTDISSQEFYILVEFINCYNLGSQSSTPPTGKRDGLEFATWYVEKYGWEIPKKNQKYLVLELTQRDQHVYVKKEGIGRKVESKGKGTSVTLRYAEVAEIELIRQKISQDGVDQQEA